VQKGEIRITGTDVSSAVKGEKQTIFKGCAILLEKCIDNILRYFKLDRLSIPIINILVASATDYLLIWR
jgi:hypothetical protein